MKKNLLICIFATTFFVLPAQNFSLLTDIKTHFSKDTRCHIFEMNETKKNGVRTLTGKTNLPDVYEQIAILAENQGIKNEIVLLPTPEIGDFQFGVVTISTAFIRSKPDYSAELLTQALLGTPVKIWEKSNIWLRIQTPDGYIGWVTATSLQQNNVQQQTAWLGSEQLIFTDLYGQSFSSPDKKSDPVSDIVAGCILKTDGKKGCFHRVFYPDGRVAYVDETQCCSLRKWQATAAASPEKIVATARRFMGIPYLWGGCSAKATDCSGFSKMVYFLNNIILPRDASQQVKIGESIDFSDNYSQLQKGDLVFFGSSASRISHVGIYIGDLQFIHASGTVHINSFDPSSPLYIARYVERLQFVKRILGQQNETISTNEFYQKK